jgi:uncharacterized protein involved in high-affinity Fe2+ transport
MKKVMTICSAIIFASFIFTSCGGGKNESENTTSDSTKTEIEVEKPIQDSKDAVKEIAGKYFIPVDESKSDLIFSINQNLNFTLVNYKGNFEGKYVDGKVQFDDKNATMIDFSLKGENVVLKNQNDVEVEFKPATDQELIIGTWYSDFQNAFGFTFMKNGNWTSKDIIYTRKGTYKYISDKKFELINSYDKSKMTLVMNDASSATISGTETIKHTRVKKGSINSLNQLFN